MANDQRLKERIEHLLRFGGEDKREQAFLLMAKGPKGLMKELTLQNPDKISPLIGSIPGLEKLMIQDGDFESLPPEIGQLNHLKKLVFDNCELFAIPSEIGLLKNLETLVFDCDELNHLPPEVGNLSNLKKLSIRNRSGNLTTLPTEIGQLTNLEELDLKNFIKLTSLPDEISQLKNLQVLNLTNCFNLFEIPNLEELTNLKQLIVTDCDILSKLPALTENVEIIGKDRYASLALAPLTLHDQSNSFHQNVFWDSKFGAWAKGMVVDGKREGTFYYYRNDKSISCETNYKNDVQHGSFKRFHENGEISQQGEFVEGVRDGLHKWTRSTDATTEHTIRPTTSEKVWSEHNFFDRGIAYFPLFYDKSGNELTEMGDLVPLRPEGVPELKASYDKLNKQWVSGQQFEGKPIGSWRWWNSLGKLIREQSYNEAYQLIEECNYYDTGMLWTKKTFVYIPERKCAYEAWYLKDGSLQEETKKTFNDEILTKSTYSGKGGKLNIEGNLVQDKMMYRFYGEEGQITSEGEIEHEKYVIGYWKFYNETGSLTHEIDLTGVGYQFSGDKIPVDTNPENFLGQALLHKMDFDELTKLEGLGQIDWGRLKGAYGKYLENFPKLISALNSKESIVRQTAFNTICCEIEHQGSMYNSTAKTVPFFIKLLEYPNTDKKELLQRLNNFADLVWPYRKEAENRLPDEPYQRIIFDISTALTNGWSIFAKFVEGDNRELQKYALALARFANQEDVLEDITKLSSNTNEPGICASAIHALLHFDVSPNVVSHYFSHNHLSIQLVSILYTGLRFGPNSPSEVVAGIRNILGANQEKFEEFEKHYYNLSFVDTDLLTKLCLALGCIGTKEARELFPILCARIDDIDDFYAEPYLKGLLRLTFGNGDLPFASDFMQVLEAIAKSKFFKEYYVNAHNVLRAWNLPKPDDMLKLVEKLQTTEAPQQEMYKYLHIHEV